jgi:hypothetical protein
MKKSLLTASVLGAISIVASSAAFANMNTSAYCKPGFYAGLQGGRSDTFYGPGVIPSPPSIPPSSSSEFTYIDEVAAENLYGRTDTFSSTTTSAMSKQDVDDTGLGGRVYAGYQFNPYFATELGYTRFATTSLSALGTTTTVQNSTSTEGYQGEQQTMLTTSTSTTTSNTAYNGDITERAIDLVAKGTIPLRYGFGVYAKAGLAYLTANRYLTSQSLGSNTTTAENIYYPNTSSTTSTSSTPAGSSSTVYDITYHGIRPVVGAGVEYSIPNTALSVDLSYMRIFASGGFQDASLASLGVGYKFA